MLFVALLALNISAQTPWIEAGEPLKITDVFFKKATWIWRDTSIVDDQRTYFRKEFETDTKKIISKAILRSTADDFFAIWINGTICGGTAQWIMPVEKNVTATLLPGRNTISSSCGNAINNIAGFIAELTITYTDGSVQTIFSNKDWKCNADDIDGYKINGFDDKKWETAIKKNSYGDGIYKNAFDRFVNAKSVQVRKEINLTGIDFARITVSGLGSYIFYINGKKQGNQELAPEWTDFNQRVNAQVFTVRSSDLQNGNNVFSALLGNGWWNSGISLDQSWDMIKAVYDDGSLKFYFQMDVFYKDKSKKTFYADQSWKWQYSPVVENTIYHGETYDARLRQDGWNKPGFNDAGWKSCTQVLAPKYTVQVQDYEPVRICDTLLPKNIIKKGDRTYLIDFGVNRTGRVKFKALGNKGDTLSMIFSEILDSAGNLNRASYRTARTTDKYIFNCGGHTETWEPQFTLRGFRYMLVKGLNQKPEKEDFVALWIHTDLETDGTFSCNDSLINKIHELSVRTGLNNYTGNFTDCPQRDERLGWLADAQLFSGASLYNWNMKKFYRKTIRDITDGQKVSGFIADVAPAKPFITSNTPGWEDALLVLAWKSYVFYGDISILKDNYSYFKQFLSFRKNFTKNGLLKHSRKSWGEWLAFEASSTELFNNVYNIYSFTLGQKIASVLKDEKQAEEYKLFADSLKRTFNRTFYKDALATYDMNVQSSLVMPLYLDIVPSEFRSKVFQTLIKNIEAHNYHLTTGIHSTASLLKCLSENGYADVAYKILKQKTYPSWGYMIDNNATTWWERWNSNTIDTKKASMNSYDHPVFGSVDEWLYSGLAGIKPLEEKPGFEEFSVMPYINNLDKFTASYNSPKGKIEVSLTTSNAIKTIHLKVPAGTKAWFIFNQNEFTLKNKEYTITDKVKKIFPGISDGYKTVFLNEGDYQFELERK